MKAARLLLVRHGRAAAGVTGDVDPGLDDEGRAQAEVMADEVASLGPLPLLTSPLRRTRETAAALERRWAVEATLEPRVAEVRWTTDDLAERGRWLRTAMARPWAALPDAQRRWRDEVVATLVALRTDTVVVSHLIAINVAIGAARDDDRVVSAMVDNCSITVLRTDGSRLELVDTGTEALTRVW